MKQKNQLYDMGIKPGVYFDMPDTEYHKVPALSYSGIKNLLISPMDFWARSWMNPRYEHQESFPMKLGTAYHTRILEGKEKFAELYASELSYDNAAFNLDEYLLRTVDEIKSVLKEHLLPVSGNKTELKERIKNHPGFIIPKDVHDNEDICKYVFWDDLKDEHYSQDKIFLPQDEIENIEYAAAFIEKHPQISKCFTGGYAEVSIFWYDETGVPLKSRIDYLKPKAIIDLKTFNNRLMKPIDLAIHNEIASRRYHLQAALYTMAAEQFKDKARELHYKKEFVFVFQQTGVAPICSAKRFSKSLITFDNGLLAIKSAIRTFHLCYATFGKEPWLTQYEITDLEDECFPAYIVEV